MDSSADNLNLSDHLYQYLIDYLKNYNKTPSHTEWTNETLTFNKTKGNEHRCVAIYERGKKQGQRCRALKQKNSNYCKVHENYNSLIDVNKLVTKLEIEELTEKINTITVELNNLKSTQ